MENTENKINEIDVIVGSEAENKPMYENMSTESANKGDSGIQTSENNDDSYEMFKII